MTTYKVPGHVSVDPDGAHSYFQRKPASQPRASETNPTTSNTIIKVTQLRQPQRIPKKRRKKNNKRETDNKIQNSPCQ